MHFLDLGKGRFSTPEQEFSGEPYKAILGAVLLKCFYDLRFADREGSDYQTAVDCLMDEYFCQWFELFDISADVVLAFVFDVLEALERLE